MSKVYVLLAHWKKQYEGHSSVVGVYETQLAADNASSEHDDEHPETRQFIFYEVEEHDVWPEEGNGPLEWVYIDEET